MKLGLVLGLVVLFSPAAVAADWVVVGDDGAKQTLVDSESIQPRTDGSVTFNQRVRAKPKTQLTPQGTTRIDSRIEASCYTMLYRIVNYTAYARNGKIVERSRVASDQKVAGYNSPDHMAINAVCN